jgi:hypothetical protein
MFWKRVCLFGAWVLIMPGGAGAVRTETRCERSAAARSRRAARPGAARRGSCGRKPGNEYVSQSRRLRFAARAIHH